MVVVTRPPALLEEDGMTDRGSEYEVSQAVAKLERDLSERQLFSQLPFSRREKHAITAHRLGLDAPTYELAVVVLGHYALDKLDGDRLVLARALTGWYFANEEWADDLPF